MLTHLRVVCDRECCHDNEDDGLQTIQHLPGFLSHLGSYHSLSDSPSRSHDFSENDLVSYSYFLCMPSMYGILRMLAFAAVVFGSVGAADPGEPDFYTSSFTFGDTRTGV